MVGPYLNASRGGHEAQDAEDVEARKHRREAVTEADHNGIPVWRFVLELYVKRFISYNLIFKTFNKIISYDHHKMAFDSRCGHTYRKSIEKHGVVVSQRRYDKKSARIFVNIGWCYLEETSLMTVLCFG